LIACGVNLWSLKPFKYEDGRKLTMKILKRKLTLENELGKSS
jgi:hypothetical protein